MKILYYEPEEAIRTIHRNYLIQHNINIEDVGTRDEFVEKLQMWKWDLIISDVDLYTDNDYRDWIDYIGHYCKNIILTTATPFSLEKNNILYKPFKRDELLDCIAITLHGGT